ncbi:MAG: hypothetical protein H0U13_10315, partial [Gemmatimonadaceae bacterium]|nr:hypothetical protein [Gemmatimonadaceae bacterium]
MNYRTYFTTALLIGSLTACAAQSASTITPEPASPPSPTNDPVVAQPAVTVADRLAKYTPVKLSADTSGLSAKERQMLP